MVESESGHPKPVILFLHGAGGSKKKWRTVFEYSQIRACLFVNLPGHAGEESSPAKSIEAYAKILCDTLDQEVVVVGHSMGGLIGIEMAARSSLVKGLVLVSSHYQLPVHQKILESLDQGIFPERLFYASYAKQASAELLREEWEANSDNSIHTVASDFHCCHQYDGKDSFETLNIPILSIYGEEDRLLPNNAMESLAAANINVESAAISGAGHYVMLEQPDNFMDALDQYIDRYIERDIRTTTS